MARRHNIGRVAKLTLLAVCLASPLCGGWCQRYKEQSQRTERMKHYYDSVLRVERLYKDSLSHELRKKEQDSVAVDQDTVRQNP